MVKLDKIANRFRVKKEDVQIKKKSSKKKIKKWSKEIPHGWLLFFVMVAFRSSAEVDLG
jgi:hypothetical protein